MYVSIGNGLVKQQSILLDYDYYMYGQSAPSDITSASNMAWLAVDREPPKFNPVVNNVLVDLKHFSRPQSLEWLLY